MNFSNNLWILMGVCLLACVSMVSHSMDVVPFLPKVEEMMAFPPLGIQNTNETLHQMASPKPQSSAESQNLRTNTRTSWKVSKKKSMENSLNFTTREDNQGNQLICSSWENNMDEWWIHHPKYEIDLETDDEFCFSRIKDPKRIEAITELYQIQWHGNCSQVLQTPTRSSGFGASFGGYVRNLYATFHDKVPYQMTKRYNTSYWLYAATNRSSWGWCESMDIDCYFLPISKCAPTIGVSDNIRRRPGFVGGTGLPLWVRWWAFRLHQHIRYRVYQLLRDQFPPLQYPCTAMHVRRGDAGLARPPFRRYAPLSEYIEAANVSSGEHVVLLTDDVTTIEEAHRFHPHVDWLYANRTRHRGTSGGFDGHTPSKDPALDMIFLLAEIRYAARCTSFVHGKSGFVGEISQEMFRLGTKVRQYSIHTEVSPSEAREQREGRGQHMLDSILENNLRNQTLTKDL